jgi:prevent-host-death family protein
MTRILVMSETRSLADVKAHLSEIIDLVESEHERVVITRHGKPAAVIVGTVDLESIEETLDILSAPGALQEIRAAEDEISRGEFLTAAELRAKYLTRD